jgi:FkbM family methyltransferase
MVGCGRSPMWGRGRRCSSRSAISTRRSGSASPATRSSRRAATAGVWPKHLSAQFRHVYTFEPDETNFGALEKNVTEANVVKRYGALGEHAGIVKMADHSADNFGAKYVVPLNGDESIAGVAPMWTVDELRLDALDLLVLDVEGYETPALRGAAHSILRFRPVIMFEDKHAERYGFQKPEEYLTTLNYRVVDRRHRDVIMVPAL